jgi:hypothetical protein
MIAPMRSLIADATNGKLSGRISVPHPLVLPNIRYFSVEDPASDTGLEGVRYLQTAV